MTESEKLAHEAERLSFNCRMTMQIDNFHDFQNEIEKICLTEKLKANNFNMSGTAKKLGIQRSHIYNLIHKLKIELKREKIESFRFMGIKYEGNYNQHFKLYELSEPKYLCFVHYLKEKGKIIS